MAHEADAVRQIVEWLEASAQHVADIVVGPKREEWFNAESIIALWRHSDIDKFVVFGEENYLSAMKETDCGKALLADDTRKRPDVVAYSPRGDDKYDVPFIIEAKVLYRSETAVVRKSSLTTLQAQLQRAKRVCPTAGAIGIVYLVSIVSGLGVTPQPFFKEVQEQIVDVFKADNLVWLRQPTVLQGLHLRGTSFAYPATTVSVGLAAFVL